ncbi:MAG: hypothetical protein Q3983_03300 [Capnocytophaga sp.]|nr:hypothetical protein [Capnocytophaga sp.]
MKRITYTLLAFAITLGSCSKWTETENNADAFEKSALDELKEKRDNAKWVAEAERTEENKKALEAYWEELREYKEKAWLNTGKAGGQTPMIYFWYSGGFWTTQQGVAKTWLQSIPDSVVAISMWGGLGTRPENISINQKKDLEVFHKKGSKVLMCWQTPSVGLGLPSSKDGKTSGYNLFREKYPFAECYNQWGEIYARELSRYIIVLNFDGYDLDWETCGDHGGESEEGTPLMMDKNNENSNLGKFVKEMAKYFGPVGENHVAKTQAEREANLKALFDASTEGFHAKEKEYIEEFTPYLPENYLTKRYYFCADVPCGVAAIFRGDNFAKYFDKHFLQDYQIDGVGTHIEHLGGNYYNSTSGNYQAGNFKVMAAKGKAVKEGKIWGLGAYHGQTDYEINNENNEQFKAYLKANNLTRKYLHYAWTREAIRIANPRPDYSSYKEKEPMIILP